MSSSNPFAQTLHLDTAPYASGASLSPAGKQARHHGRTHSGSSISLSTPVYPGSQPSSSPHSHSWGSFRSSLSPAAFPASASDPSSPGSDPGQSGSVAKSQSHSHSADQIAPSMIGLPLSVNPYGRTTNFDVDHPQSYDTGTMSGLMNPPSTTGLGYTAQQYIQSSLPPQTPDEPRPSLLVTQQRYAAAQQKKLSEQAWRQQLQSQEAARALQEQQLGNIFPSLAHTHSAFPGNTRSDTTSSGESLGLNQPWAQAAGSGVFQHTNSSTSPLSLSPSHARANSFSNPPSSISQTLTSAGVSIDGSAAFPAPDNAALTSLGLGSSNDHILSSPYRSGSFFVASPPSASGDLLGSGSPNGNNNPYPLFPAESYNQQALFSSPPMGSYGGGGGGAAAANVQLNQSNSSAYPFPQTMSSSGPNNLANTLSISTNTSPGAAAPTSTTSRAQRQPASASASASTSTSPSSPQKQNQRNQPPRSTRARPSPTSTRKGPAHARTTSGGSVPASRVTQKNASSHRPEKRSRAEEAEESESDDGDGDGLDSGGKDGRSAEGGVKPRLRRSAVRFTISICGRPPWG
ncbi:hypothetical protein BOTBODRAFT_413556 [Botryobasidium botryosum FD-172 SS1]|uniref:Uncharacterized protein n=1 Tax=Botryobasidium botryosum (strain FD-172 SS1) TaxID=930990 RepID=A0A067MM00_BOTB1|nr:hypothetical protein BOTBODRAFT_413556 [Botryobasidium botryosum FD-172 SS1]